MIDVPRGPQGEDTLQMYMENGRLRLIANVDLTGARRLSKILPLLIKCLDAMGEKGK